MLRLQNTYKPIFHQKLFVCDVLPADWLIDCNNYSGVKVPVAPVVAANLLDPLGT